MQASSVVAAGIEGERALERLGYPEPSVDGVEPLLPFGHCPHQRRRRLRRGGDRRDQVLNLSSETPGLLLQLRESSLTRLPFFSARKPCFSSQRVKLLLC